MLADTLLRLRRIAAGRYSLLDGTVPVGTVIRERQGWTVVALAGTVAGVQYHYSTLAAALASADRRYCYA